MEIAATVILAAGIRAVVAESFARTFYRNGINNGLLPVECDTSGIVEGDDIIVRLADDRVEVANVRSGTLTAARPLPPFMQEIQSLGGLVQYLRSHGGKMEG
jgi:3-isopropylmalate/(R)-2-methylmalate dehydratase small subunit